MKFELLLTVACLLSGTSAIAEENPFAKFGFAREASGTLLKPAIVPAQFRGEWNGELRTCGKNSSDTRLIIFSRKIAFYESDGEVKSIRLLNSRAITVKATYSGEGQVWDRVDQMVLSRSGNELTITSADATSRESSSFTRFRCPVKVKKR